MKNTKWLPYLLLLPSLIYLALFFAYPMVQSLRLAFVKEGQYLNLRAEPEADAETVGELVLQTDVAVIDRVRGEEVLPNGRTRPVYWFLVEAQDAAGELVQGWVSQSNVFIESRTESDTARIVSGEPTRSEERRVG